MAHGVTGCLNINIELSTIMLNEYFCRDFTCLVFPFVQVIMNGIVLRMARSSRISSTFLNQTVQLIAVWMLIKMKRSKVNRRMPVLKTTIL
jgi:hypothetical protein